MSTGQEVAFPQNQLRGISSVVQMLRCGSDVIPSCEASKPGPVGLLRILTSFLLKQPERILLFPPQSLGCSRSHDGEHAWSACLPPITFSETSP